MTAAPGQKECDSAVRNVQVFISLSQLSNWSNTRRPALYIFLRLLVNMWYLSPPISVFEWHYVQSPGSVVHIVFLSIVNLAFGNHYRRMRLLLEETFLVNNAAPISVSLAFGPHSRASAVNATVGDWPPIPFPIQHSFSSLDYFSG